MPDLTIVIAERMVCKYCFVTKDTHNQNDECPKRRPDYLERPPVNHVWVTLSEAYYNA